MKSWLEFLEDDKGRGSSTRLCMLYGVFLGGAVVTYLTLTNSLTYEIFAIFMFSSGGVYGLSKIPSPRSHNVDRP